MPEITTLGFSRHHRRDVVDVDFQLPETNQIFPDLGFTDDKIETMSVDKLIAGTIRSQTITLGILDTAGDVYIAGGTFDATAWTATNGFILGLDDSDSNREKMFIGNAVSSMDWNVTTVDTLTISGTIFATAGTIGGWNITSTVLRSGATDAASNVLIDSANSLFRLGPTSGDSITIDGANQRIRSSNYVAGMAGAGFTLEPDLLEVGNIAARGIIRTAVFQKDIISAVGGNLFVTPSDVLTTDMTALDASTLTVEGNETFAVNDILRIRDNTDDEWLLVTNIASAPTYTVTRDQAGVYGADSNPAWTRGATVVNYQQSGDGYLFMTASQANAPFYSVHTHAGSPWSTVTERVRVGNLNGFLDIASDVYGFGAGETNKYLTYDPTNGLRVMGKINTQIEVTAGISITAGNIVVVRTFSSLVNHGSETFSVPTDDARVDEANPDTNYGTATTCPVGDDAGSNANWLFMKWDISNTRYPTVAQRCFIRLKWANHNGLDGVATNHRLNVYQVTGADWAEGTITWNNMPAISGTAEDQWSPSPSDSIEIRDSIFNQTIAAGKWVWLDITTLYNAWKAGSQANYGVAIRLEAAAGGETTDVRLTDIVTSENATEENKPVLLFTGVMASNPGRAWTAGNQSLIDTSQGQIGIALNSADPGEDVVIQIAGIYETTGLTPNIDYYFYNSGALSTTNGIRKIGKSLSTTELLLDIQPSASTPFYFKYVYGGITGGGDSNNINNIPVFFGTNYSNAKIFASGTKAGGSETLIIGELCIKETDNHYTTGGGATNTTRFWAHGDSGTSYSIIDIGSGNYDNVDKINFSWNTDGTNDNTVDGWITFTY